MENKIKITKDYKVDYVDLMKEVDFDTEFTLRDILRACVNCKISHNILSQILRCNYILDYWEEANKEDFVNDGEVEYLEVYWSGAIDTFSDVRSSSNHWGFHGVGREGIVPEDIRNFYKPEQVQKLIDDKFREKYAIEFSPMWKIVDYTIKIKDEIIVDDWDKDVDNMTTVIKFTPSITLIELLYAIFWELSFAGSPETRDKMMNELEERAKNIDLSKSVSFEEVKAKLSEKYNLDKPNGD